MKSSTDDSELTVADAAAPDFHREPQTLESAASKPLRSVHTTSFAELLEEFGISVLVTTYQAGRLVVLRAEQGVLNTHFRSFASPMGLALSGPRLAVGVQGQICEFHDTPAVARRLEPAGRHDACFLPRVAHVTGAIDIHEMAWIEDQLWFVNTKFSCLCTRSDQYSFTPRWRPWFVSKLAPEDRCHLNGLAVVGGVPQYVTTLGETDTPGGWRANKRDGGLLLDIQSNAIVARGLSMPHSPRWYAGRLWVLDSGNGGVGTVDPFSGRYDELIQLPGFTRGLTFHGPLAFVGLSQVRESAVFSGIPLVDRLADRTCGVWVLDLRSGETVAFVKFEEALQEIFAVEVVPGVRFPDVINDDPELLGNSYVLPNEALGDVPPELRVRA
jgi:uncharacterized protein (TIGR03032 family)